MKSLVKSVAFVAALSLLAAACTETETTDETTEETEETEETTDDSETMDDDEEVAAEEPATVVALAQSNDDFSILVEAVVAADLVETLSAEDGTFTVFAPTNDAFAAALVALDTTKEDLFADKEALADILTYHVLDAEVDAAAATAAVGTDVETVQGSSLAVTAEGEGLQVGGANVTATDLKAGNGIVHVIDAVLLPPS